MSDKGNLHTPKLILMKAPFAIGLPLGGIWLGLLVARWLGIGPSFAALVLWFGGFLAGGYAAGSVMVWLEKRFAE